MKLIFALIFSICLFSCISYKDVSVSGIKGFKVNKINKESMEAEISVQIKNPNSFGFKIFSGKAEVYFGGILLGKAKLVKKVKIPKNSDGVYDMRLNTSFDKISIKDIMSGILNSDAGKLKIKGYIKVGNFFYRKKVYTEDERFSYSGIKIKH